MDAGNHRNDRYRVHHLGEHFHHHYGIIDVLDDSLLRNWRTKTKRGKGRVWTTPDERIAQSLCDIMNGGIAGLGKISLGNLDPPVRENAKQWSIASNRAGSRNVAVRAASAFTQCPTCKAMVKGPCQTCNEPPT